LQPFPNPARQARTPVLREAATVEGGARPRRADPAPRVGVYVPKSRAVVAGWWPGSSVSDLEKVLVVDDEAVIREMAT